MKTKLLIFYILVFSTSILNASVNSSWIMSQTSKNNHYKIDLHCDHPPTLKGFQSCSFTLSNKTNLIPSANIVMEGGMPEHHHGLPTTPKISWDSNKNIYIINGLKFSMPGAWQLTFLIDKTDNLPRDLATLKFEIN